MEEFGLRRMIVKACGDAGIDHPNEVQQAYLKHAMAGEDVLVQCGKDRGKCSMAAMATIHQMLPPLGKDLVILALCGTKEKADKVHRTFCTVASRLPFLQIELFSGKKDLAKNKSLLEKAGKPHIAVGTIGRIRELVNEMQETSRLDVSQVLHVVVHDASMMFGKPDVVEQFKHVFAQCHPSKQFLLLSSEMDNLHFVELCKSTLKGVMKKYFFKDLSGLSLSADQAKHAAVASGKQKSLMEVMVPSSSFPQLGVKEEVTYVLSEMSFVTPTHVQDVCIPRVVKGDNVLCSVRSDVGSSSMALIAGLSAVGPVTDRQQDKVELLVLHELKEKLSEMEDFLQRLSKLMFGLRIRAHHGGRSEGLYDGKPQVVLGTPPRVAYLCEQSILDLATVKHIVLDDAGNMLNKPAIRERVYEILRDYVKEKCQLTVITKPDHPVKRPALKAFIGTFGGEREFFEYSQDSLDTYIAESKKQNSVS